MVGTHKLRTLRGTAVEGLTTRLVVADGNLNHGYRVIDFVVTSRYPAGADNAAFGTLHLDYDTDATWQWSDNRQIAWCSSALGARQSGTAGAVAPFKVIDPDHVVLQDLYLTCQLGSGTGEGAFVNYMVILETVELSDDEAILTLIKERSQDDLR
jgi:hypothetical protein